MDPYTASSSPIYDFTTPPNSPGADEEEWENVTVGNNTYLVSHYVVRNIECRLERACNEGEASAEGRIDRLERAHDDISYLYMEQLKDVRRPIPKRCSCNSMFESQLY
jgi:hypothetical protein